MLPAHSTTSLQCYGITAVRCGQFASWCFGRQVAGGAVRVTPMFVQAAEAVLRCALEPTLEPLPPYLQKSSAQQASSCRTSAACATLVSARLGLC